MNLIKLDADETMLLLITKNHQHKNVPLGNMPSGSLEYIQTVNNFRVWGGPSEKVAPLYTPYSNLCLKTLTNYQYSNVLDEIHKHLTGLWIGQNEIFTEKYLLRYMISALAQRVVTDLILDKSLIAQKGD